MSKVPNLLKPTWGSVGRSINMRTMVLADVLSINPQDIITVNTRELQDFPFGKAPLLLLLLLVHLSVPAAVSVQLCHVCLRSSKRQECRAKLTLRFLLAQDFLLLVGLLKTREAIHLFVHSVCTLQNGQTVCACVFVSSC